MEAVDAALKSLDDTANSLGIAKALKSKPPKNAGPEFRRTFNAINTLVRRVWIGFHLFASLKKAKLLNADIRTDDEALEDFAANIRQWPSLLELYVRKMDLLKALDPETAIPTPITYQFESLRTLLKDFAYERAANWDGSDQKAVE